MASQDRPAAVQPATGGFGPTVRLVVGLSDPERERELLPALGETGSVIIVERCLTADHLLARVQGGDVDAALVAADLHRLSAEGIARLAAMGTPMVMLASDGDVGRWLRGPGCVLPPQADAAAVRQALVALLRDVRDAPVAPVPEIAGTSGQSGPSDALAASPVGEADPSDLVGGPDSGREAAEEPSWDRVYRPDQSPLFATDSVSALELAAGAQRQVVPPIQAVSRSQSLAAWPDRVPAAVRTGGQEEVDAAAPRRTGTDTGECGRAVSDLGPVTNFHTRSAPSTLGRENGRPEHAPLIVAVVGSYGSPGTTTVALNLAAALGAAVPTVLVDADLVKPSVAARLDVDPTRNLYMLAQAEPETSRDWERALTQESQPLAHHLPQAAVLCGVPKPQMRYAVSKPFFGRLLCELQRRYRHVVLDLGVGDDLQEPHRSALLSAAHVLLVTSADLIGLWHARSALAGLATPASGWDRGAGVVALVLNRHDGRYHYGRQDVERALGAGTAAVVPYDYRAVQRALAEQRPLVFDPRSRAGRALLDLAERLHGGSVQPPEAPRGSLVGRLRWGWSSDRSYISTRARPTEVAACIGREPPARLQSPRSLLRRIGSALLLRRAPDVQRTSRTAIGPETETGIGERDIRWGASSEHTSARGNGGAVARVGADGSNQ